MWGDRWKLTEQLHAHSSSVTHIFRSTFTRFFSFWRLSFRVLNRWKPNGTFGGAVQQLTSGCKQKAQSQTDWGFIQKAAVFQIKKRQQKQTNIWAFVVKLYKNHCFCFTGFQIELWFFSPRVSGCERSPACPCWRSWVLQTSASPWNKQKTLFVFLFWT